MGSLNDLLQKSSNTWNFFRKFNSLSQEKLIYSNQPTVILSDERPQQTNSVDQLTSHPLWVLFYIDITFTERSDKESRERVESMERSFFLSFNSLDGFCWLLSRGREVDVGLRG